MFDIIKKIWKVGTVTEKQPFQPAPAAYKGRIRLLDVPDTNWQECAAVCPTGALKVQGRTVTLFEGGCIFCGSCAEACRTDGIVQTNDCYMAQLDKAALYQKLILKEEVAK